MLLGISLALIFPLALLVGTISALRRGSLLDAGLQVSMLVLASLPSFVVGIALIVVFSLIGRATCGLPRPHAGVADPPDRDAGARLDASHGSHGQSGRRRRAEFRLRANGSTQGPLEQGVIRSHVLPNSLVPAIQAFALTAAGMPAGIVIVEYLFRTRGSESL